MLYHLSPIMSVCNEYHDGLHISLKLLFQCMKGVNVQMKDRQNAATELLGYPEFLCYCSTKCILQQQIHLEVASSLIEFMYCTEFQRKISIYCQYLFPCSPVFRSFQLLGRVYSQLIITPNSQAESPILNISSCRPIWKEELD